MKIASRLLVTRREDRLRDACKQRGEMEEGRPAPMSSSLAVVKGTTSSTKARCRDSLGFQREKGQDTASSWAPDALDWPHVAQVVIPALGSEWVVKSGKKGKQPGLSSRWDEEGDRTIQPRVALSRGGRGCQHAAGGCCQGALQAPLPRQKGDWGGLWALIPCVALAHSPALLMPRRTLAPMKISEADRRLASQYSRKLGVGAPQLLSCPHSRMHRWLPRRERASQG